MTVYAPVTDPKHPDHRGIAPMLRIAALLIALLLFSSARAEVVDRIVAIVGDDLVTQSEVEEMARPILEKLARKGSDADPQRILRRALEEIIINKLRDQESARLGLKVTDERVDEAMAMVESKNGWAPGSLKGKLKEQGIPYDIYREQIRSQILQGKLINKVIRPMVTVNEEEIQDLDRTMETRKGNDEIRLGHILLQIDGNAPKSAREEVERKTMELIERLKNGESFTALASQYSDDSSALNGGDMGWFKRGELLPEMELVVFRLAKGEVGGPLRSSQGLHLFMALDTRSSGDAEGADLSASDTQVWVRHILIPFAEGSDEQIVETLTRLRKSVLEDGEDFAELAKRYSRDGSAKEGGDLGWFGEGVMVPAFERVAFSLQEKEVSVPVRTEFGWHLIYMEGKREQKGQADKTRRKKLEDRVRSAKVEARYKQWLRDLRMKAFVEYR